MADNAHRIVGRGLLDFVQIIIQCREEAIGSSIAVNVAAIYRPIVVVDIRAHVPEPNITCRCLIGIEVTAPDGKSAAITVIKRDVGIGSRDKPETGVLCAVGKSPNDRAVHHNCLIVEQDEGQCARDIISLQGEIATRS